MRAAQQRPRSQHGTASSPKKPGPLPVRRIFNCIVDDTALVAGVKRTTRNGIRQWVKNAQIRLFVPLHALEQLSRQKNGSSRHAEDVRETLQWLDDATSRYPHAVTLQGGDQYYETWAEVEAFSIPRTLFSEYNHDHEEENFREDELVSQIQPLTLEAISSLQDGEAHVEHEARSNFGSAISQNLSTSPERSLGTSASALSPPTSPKKKANSPQQNSLGSPARIDDGCASSVPRPLHSLFNYILWRVHQELDPVAALESFIFLCNDPVKVNYARGFDIRSKRLEQLREAVSREDRDFRNRQMVQMREAEVAQAPVVEPSPEGDRDHAASSVARASPPQAPAAAAVPAPKQTSQPSNVIDPNSFGRGQKSNAVEMPRSPRAKNVEMSPRFNFSPRSPRGGARGNGHDGRGRTAKQAGGRAGDMPAQVVAEAVAEKKSQIDPDSFARPRESGQAGRGGRKLWMPT